MSALAILSIVGTIGGFLLIAIKPSHQRRVAGALAIIFSIALFYWACHQQSPLDIQVSTDEGSSTLGSLLSLLSRGPVTVTLDPTEKGALSNQKIWTPRLKDARLRYVIDTVLLPQLQPVGQWTYTVSGNTVTIRRRR